MFLVTGSIVVERLRDGSQRKIHIKGFDQNNFTDLFRFTKEMNQPHFDRIKDVFAWLNDNRSKPNKLGEILTTQLVLKHPPEDPSLLPNHIKKQYLEAYNTYYDVVYLPEDVDLK
jgi:hypothetical protein